MIFTAITKSLIHFTKELVPSSVSVVDTADYGVLIANNGKKIPAVGVEINRYTDTPVELGSQSTVINVIFTVTAKSQQQRDALKELVYKGIKEQTLLYYPTFSGEIPTSSGIECFDLGRSTYVRDVPDLDADNPDKYFTSLVYAEYTYLGV